MTLNLSSEDHIKIRDRIRDNETRTSGEIYAVVARQSDGYQFVVGCYALAISLILGVTLWCLNIFYPMGATAGWILLVQFINAVVLFSLSRVSPAFKRLLVPDRIAYRRASRNAVQQFLAHGVHNTENRSGVLIFVSLEERYAEVVADAAINSKVDQEEWNRMVAGLVDHAAKGALADGFLQAIDQAGALLAEHFPPVQGQENELDDKLVEI